MRLKRTFRPEFLNRVDNVVVFRQLQKQDIRQIVDIILGEVNERLVEHELVLASTDAARDWLGEHGYDPEFGARPLRRLIQTEVEDLLSDAVLAGTFKHGRHRLSRRGRGQTHPAPRGAGRCRSQRRRRSAAAV